MSVSPGKRNLAGKALDPVFITMVGAMVLAVASSLMLRAVAGPRPVSASETETRLPPLRHVPPAATHPQ